MFRMMVQKNDSTTKVCRYQIHLLAHKNSLPTRAFKVSLRNPKVDNSCTKLNFKSNYLPLSPPEIVNSSQQPLKENHFRVHVIPLKNTCWVE